MPCLDSEVAKAWELLTSIRIFARMTPSGKAPDPPHSARSEHTPSVFPHLPDQRGGGAHEPGPHLCHGLALSLRNRPTLLLQLKCWTLLQDGGCHQRSACAGLLLGIPLAVLDCCQHLVSCGSFSKVGDGGNDSGALRQEPGVTTTHRKE